MNDTKSLRIRPAVLADLDIIMGIFDHARSFMSSVGNPTQWINGYPQRELIESEIVSGNCFVCVTPEDFLVATFCFIVGDDPTYRHIESGAWLNDKPYAVLHRLASDGTYTGIFDFCISWCFARCQNLRVDTHHDNLILQRLLLKHGFSYCGIIYVADGTPRMAFQCSLDNA